jgi:hypothetical protein
MPRSRPGEYESDPQPHPKKQNNPAYAVSNICDLLTGKQEPNRNAERTKGVNRRAKLALTQIWCNSDRTDQAGLEEIDLSSAVHLTFDELELGDLTFGLSVRPRQSDRSADRGFVFGDAAGEGSHQA